ncbi:TetR/AcrR family transcriptional regulator [Rhodocytophaga aerolata]|uniref:TetR/AcrR family transcriptional regulator n=1 Tax=Rhodocytophaga aerolata TaxID=455078 RepID=A0ABT8REL7_9BACT|nr:TetR/AcrR family transcriptional regulator [Rhodocytophaga aerolata]MDO1450131.1 TetR/AcrR family transcriptional regulator [Rhodocytophaga aerolata]
MTKAERTRQLILEKAAPLFNTKGVAGTSLSDILEVTKLAKGSLYVHFENKEDLAHEVVDYQLDRLANVVETAMSRKKTAKEKLFAYIDLYLDPLNPPIIGGCPLLNFGMEADDTDEVIRKKVHQLVEKAQQNIRSIVERGIETGELKSDWDAKEFATTMFAMVEGGIMMSRIAGNNKAMQVIARSLKNEIEEKVN